MIRKFARTALAVTLATLAAGSAGAGTASYTALTSFGTTDATQNLPAGQLALGRDGNYYGTLNNNHSQIFRVSPGGVIAKLWNSSLLTGDYPADVCYSGLTLGPDGLLYGTCQQFSISNTTYDTAGVIFSYNPRLGQSGFKVIHAFPPIGSYGVSLSPSALTVGNDGYLYGTTQGGGAGDPNPNGSIFKVSTTGTFTLLYAFQGAGANDGATPGGLTLGSDGNFYGVTQSGGVAGQTNAGTVFKMTPAGSVMILHDFNQNAGGNTPVAALTEGLDGNFYGSTFLGGQANEGTLFQITPTGTLTSLHDLNAATDFGAYPNEPLTLAPAGVLYFPLETAAHGGVGSESLSSLTTSGHYTAIFHGFLEPNGTICQGYEADQNGCLLSSPLALDPSGLFFGITQQGGSEGRGEFYRFFTGVKPFVSLEFPVGAPGTVVGIAGRSISTTRSVTFDGVSASFQVIGTNYLLATVPAGATTGPVIVKTATASFQGNVPFNVLP